MMQQTSIFLCSRLKQPIYNQLIKFIHCFYCISVASKQIIVIINQNLMYAIRFNYVLVRMYLPQQSRKEIAKNRLVSKHYEQEIYHTVVYVFVLECGFHSHHTLCIQTSLVVMPNLAFLSIFKMSNVLSHILSNFYSAFEECRICHQQLICNIQIHVDDYEHFVCCNFSVL